MTKSIAPWEVDGYAEHRDHVKATWLDKHLDFQRPAGSKGLGAHRAFGWKEQLLVLMDPNRGLIPGSDEVETEVSASITQEEPTPVIQKTEGVIVSEG